MPRLRPMQQSIHQLGITTAIPCLLLIALAGCGGGDRRAVEGTVTLDGQPLEGGEIVFRPIDNTEGPSAGSDIADGRFAIASQDVPFVGEYRVEIRAWRPTGRRLDPDSGEMVTFSEQFLPPRYNERSELRETVAPDGPNSFTFEIETR